jgi:hypothetical protein
MAITETEFLDDRVRVHYNCIKPWATDDERAVVEVLHESLGTMAGAPPLDHGGGIWRESWEESVYIAGCKATISFRFARWQETDDCRMEALIGGPYLGTLGQLDTAA